MVASVVAVGSAAIAVSEIGEALSGIFGCISFVSWICLLLPQLITNYKAKSADALSMPFLFIWLMGDVTNLAGALVTELAPSAVAIGCYFVVADVALISQCLYYNTRNARRRQRLLSTQTAEGASADEDEPLLAPRRRSSSVAAAGLPGSHRRHSARRDSSGLDPLTRIVTGEDETPQRSAWLTNTLSLVAVYALGTAAWFVSHEVVGADGDAGAPPVDEPGFDDDGGLHAADKPIVIVGMVLGYISALCYLCARIPQIIKNYREKSTEGLALLFFLLSLTGNFTYGASLVSYSQEGAYLLKALPWLLGSLGTIVEDSIIFVQFRLYSPRKETKALASGHGEDNGPEYAS